MEYPIDLSSFDITTIKFVNKYSNNIYNLNFVYNDNLITLISSYLKFSPKIYYQKIYDIYGNKSILNLNINLNNKKDKYDTVFNNHNKIINKCEITKHQYLKKINDKLSSMIIYYKVNKSKNSISKNISNIEEKYIYEWYFNNYIKFKLIRNINNNKCQYEINIDVFEEKTLIESKKKIINNKINDINNILSNIYGV